MITQIFILLASGYNYDDPKLIGYDIKKIIHKAVIRNFYR